MEVKRPREEETTNRVAKGQADKRKENFIRPLINSSFVDQKDNSGTGLEGKETEEMEGEEDKGISLEKLSTGVGLTAGTLSILKTMGWM